MEINVEINNQMFCFLKQVEETERRWQVSDTNEASVFSVVTDPHLKQLKWLFDEEKEQVR